MEAGQVLPPSPLFPNPPFRTCSTHAPLPPPARLAVNLLLVFVLWDLKAVFYALWTPFQWLVGYVDPRKAPDQDPLYGR